MPEQEKTNENKKQTKIITWKEFLESHPPGSSIAISEYRLAKYTDKIKLRMPDVELYCDNQVCNGIRFFELKEGNEYLYWDTWNERFFTYQCKNCELNWKRFAVAVNPNKDGTCDAYKIGEMPPFGPHVPSRLIKLIGPDRDFFLRGRRAESQGMGIGAFTYYRRVVENQKNRILDEVIKVGEKTGFAEESLDILRQAKFENQFLKAIDSVRDAIPQFLLVDGRNPLTLLHSALSEGLHAKSDEECLELAKSIRIVLTELAIRSAQVLKDKAELKIAVNRLLKKKTGKKNSEDDKPQG